MSLVGDLNSYMVDRCIVCGSYEHLRARRRVTVTAGGAYAELELTIEYCADSSACGEARALALADTLVAPFVVADLRRRGHSLLDLKVPEPSRDEDE